MLRLVGNGLFLNGWCQEESLRAAALYVEGRPATANFFGTATLQIAEIKWTTTQEIPGRNQTQKTKLLKDTTTNLDIKGTQESKSQTRARADQSRTGKFLSSQTGNACTEFTPVSTSPPFGRPPTTCGMYEDTEAALLSSCQQRLDRGEQQRLRGGEMN